MPGKQWNKRLVAAEIHSERFQKIYHQKMKEYTGEGQANLRTYSGAVTALLDELTEEELEECQELADLWNREAVPKAVQQKWATYALLREEGLIKCFTGQPNVFQDWSENLWLQPNGRWASRFSCWFHTRTQMGMLQFQSTLCSPKQLIAKP